MGVVSDLLLLLFLSIFWYSKLKLTSPSKRSPLSQAHLVNKWSDNRNIIPLSPSCIVERVLMLHNCKRRCSNKGCGRICHCKTLCQIQTFCAKTKTYDCQFTSCRKQHIKQDRHNNKYNEYIVIDSELGFQDCL